MKKITFLFLLFLSLGHAQNVSTYLFSESAENYVPVSGITSTASGDDGSENSIPIGFPFKFGTELYETFSISTNGWIRLGSTVGGMSYSNLLANVNTRSPLIAPFWDDHNVNTGNIQHAMSGIAPNRILEVGWERINLGTTGQANGIAFASFKLRLHETTDQIDFIYSNVMDTNVVLSSSVGLNDSNSFLSVSPGVNSTVSSVTANNNINVTTNVLGKKFTFLPPVACSGTPDPGNTLASTTAVCAGSNVMLTLQNPVMSSGITYQWKSSADGIVYTNIPNAVSPSITTTQTAETYYKCSLSCAGNVGESTPVRVGMLGFLSCYCIPTYSSGMTSGDLIAQVEIEGTTLLNATGTTVLNPPYTYFSGQENYTATLEAGTDYVMNVTVGPYSNQNIAVWIDANDDGMFGTDERIGTTETPIFENATGTLPLAIGCDFPPGVHRMRIRDVYNVGSQNITPCGNFQYGETEDYDVTITPATGCQMPFGLDATNIRDISADLHWIARCSATASWDVNLVELGGGVPTGTPTHPNFINGQTASGLAPSTNYEFYVRANCGENGSSEWAGPYTFTTKPPAITNDDCGNAIALEVGTDFADHMIVASNIDATTSTGVRVPNCASAGFGGDVWFSVVVPADGNLTIELQQNPGSPIIDTGLSAYTGTCGNLTILNCDDESGIGSFSMLNLSGLTPGQTIYARVWEYANDAFGTFQVAAWNSTLAAPSFDNSKFEFYPNPVKDMLSVSYNQNIAKAEIFNLLGQRIFIKEIGTNKTELDLSNLSKGAYLLKVYAENNQQKTIKIIKE